MWRLLLHLSLKSRSGHLRFESMSTHQVRVPTGSVIRRATPPVFPPSIVVTPESARRVSLQGVFARRSM